MIVFLSVVFWLSSLLPQSKDFHEQGTKMRSLLFVLSLICFCSQTALSWKKEEFRSCDQTPFCKRARSRTPGACSLIVGDVSITDGDLVAKLLPKAPNQGDLQGWDRAA